MAAASDANRIALRAFAGGFLDRAALAEVARRAARLGEQASLEEILSPWLDAARIAALAGAPASTAAPDALVGRTLGEFVVRGKLGEGGFGAVYRAEQPMLSRDVVIKVLHSRHRDRETATERFLREAQLASQLVHPYAAHIYAFGVEQDGLMWIAMELVPGTPLDRLLRQSGPLSLDRLVPLLERLCEVVHTGHEQGIIHRDLKPANVIVLARAGRLLPKLLDFGIAKMVAAPEPVSAAPSGGEALAVPRALAQAETVDVKAGGGASTPPSRSGGALTEQGLAIGSPPYMAPEQWENAASAERRTDLYALGILAYECLTGHPPFRGASLLDIARAHQKSPVPPLPEKLHALDAVFARALAKAPADRYPSALDFARAFRNASGQAGGEPQLPQLDESLRVELAARWPQPLAEAATALDAARNPHQARDAVWETLRAAVRTLAVLSLASRTSVGPGAAADADPVVERLRALRRRTLEDREWLALCRDLSAPFAERRDAHPIPELVAFFHEGGAAGFEALFALQAEPTSTGEDPIRSLVARSVRALETLLRALSFLAEYPLVVQRDGRSESLMGIRRARRPGAVLDHPRLREGEVFLLDRAGAPALALSPLVQVAPAAPGGADEVFLLDRRSRRGAILVAHPHGFEREDESMWRWFAENLLAEGGAADETTHEERPPYRGLEAFGPADADLFFGREREIVAFVNRLRVQSLLAVVGPSGAGKSSFVQAGVIPALPAGWSALTLRPGPTPLATLEARLAQLPADDGTTSVVVVDQLEELFTLCPDAGERARFAEMLVRAAGERVRVVFTLRDDFLVRAQALPALRDRLAPGLELLAAPAPDQLVKILVEPARRAGYDFEDDELPREMVAAVADQPGALALLSFTAARLWELRDRHFKQLPRRAYDGMGGVGGALARHAEQTLAGLAPEDQRLVREAFRALVTAEGTRAVLAQADLVHILGGGGRAEAVLARLVAARLLVASEAEGGELRIEIIHEALIAGWPRLAAWRRDDAEDTRFRDQLRAAARQWDERGRAAGLLWRDDALVELSRWRARGAASLGAVAEAFAAASLGEEARARRNRRAAVIAAFLAVAGAALALFVLFRRAERAVTAQYLDQGRQALLLGQAPQALTYLSAAMSRGARGPAVELLVALAARPLEAHRRTFAGHRAAVNTAAFSADGRWLATASADSTARVWDAASGRLAAELTGHGGEVLGVTFAGDRVLTWSRDNSARLWRDGRLLLELPGEREATGRWITHAEPDAAGERILTADTNGIARVRRASGEDVVRLEGHPLLHPQRNAVFTAAFSPDGTRVVTASDDRTAKLWDAASGRELAHLVGHDGPVSFAAISVTGEIVTTSEDRTARLWDANGGLLHVLEGHTAAVPMAEFNASGAALVTAGADGEARVWDTRNGRLTAVLRGHLGPLAAARFSPDGRRVVTASGDGTARVFDALDGTPLISLEGHASQLRDVRFSPAGDLVLTASADGTARLWDVSAAGVTTLRGHEGAVNAARIAGARVVTAGEDGTARIWDAASGAPLQVLRGHAMLLTGVELSPDGRLAVTLSDDHTAKVWRVSDGALLTTFAGHHDEALRGAAFVPDGSKVITVGNDSTAQVWDPQTGRALATLAGHGRPGHGLYDGALRHITVSPDGRLAVTSSADTTAGVWDLASGARVATLGGHGGGVNMAAFSPDGALVATADAGGGARVWQTADFRPAAADAALHQGSAVLRVVFSPDGETLVTAGVDSTVRLWKRSGVLAATLDAHTGRVGHAAFTPDGSFLVTGGDDKTVRVWDARDHQILATFRGHLAPVTGLSVSADGRSVVSSSADGTARVWRLDRDTRGAAEIARLVECKDPFRIRNQQLIKTPVSGADCGP